MDKKLLAPCGTNCSLCSYYRKERNPHCPGCGTVRGRPFWGECKLYTCSIDHEVEHCGLCMHGFMSSATDGGKDGADTFRIRICEITSEDVVYDNKVDSTDETELGGGSIIVHK